MKPPCFTLPLILAFATIAPSLAAAQGAIDRCVRGVDGLAPGATAFGTEVADSARAQSVAQDCETAEQQAVQWPILRLATARALVWAGREDAALVRLEQIIGSNQGAADLAASLCARGTGSARVLDTTCGWLAANPPGDPAVAMAAGQRLLLAGNGEAALSAIGLAAQGGDQAAVRFATDTCLAFDPANLAAISSAHPAFAALDPAFVAALSCEAAYVALPTGDPTAAEAGFNFANAMTFFDDYASVGGALLELADSQDPGVAGRAVDAAIALCTALAGDPNDAAVGANGVLDHEIIADRALPMCEAAAYVAPTEGAMHYNLARVYDVSGDPASADAAWAEAQRLGYRLASGNPPSGGAMAGGGSMGGVQVLGPGGQVAFNLFNKPDWIRAFHSANVASLNNNRTNVVLYLKSLMKPFEDPSVWFRTGSQFQLAQDPTLMPILEMKVMTDSGIHNQIGGAALECIWGGLTRGAEERKRQQQYGIFDPGTEMGEMMKGCYGGVYGGGQGQMGGIMPLYVLKSQGEQDGIRLLEIFNTSPAEFQRIYEGIRKFVYSS